MSNDYYRLLGVDRRASSEALRHAFRDQLKHVHPDHNPDDTLACERTRMIVEAYRALSNPRARRRHDISLTQAAPLYKVPTRPQRPLLHPTLARALSVCIFIVVGLVAAIIASALTDGHRGLGRADLPCTQSWRSEQRPATLAGCDPYGRRAWYHCQSSQPRPIDTSSISGLQIPYANGVRLASAPVGLCSVASCTQYTYTQWLSIDQTDTP